MRLNTDRLLLEARRSRKGLALLLLICLVGGGVAAVVFKNLTYARPFADYEIVRVAAQDVKGVVAGKSQVRISGVRAGVVDKVNLVDGEPVMDLRVEPEFAPIYKNARVQMRPVTPLQDIYVNILDRGDESAGKTNADYIIPARFSISPVDASRVLATFNTSTRERLTSLLNELGPALGEDGGAKLEAAFIQAAPFLKVAQDTTRVLAEREENVRRLVDNFGNVSQALADRDAQLTTLVRQGNSTLNELTVNDAAFDDTLQSIPPTLTALRTTFTDLRALSDELDPTLRSLRPVADNLEPGLNALGRLGRDALPALRALRPALTDLRPMANTLVPTSRSLQTAFTQLRGQTPQLDNLTSEIVPCQDELRRFFEHTPSVLKFYDGLAAFPRAETTVGFEVAGEPALPSTFKALPRCVKKDG